MEKWEIFAMVLVVGGQELLRSCSTLTLTVPFLGLFIVWTKCFDQGDNLAPKFNARNRRRIQRFLGDLLLFTQILHNIIQSRITGFFVHEPLYFCGND